MVAALAGGAATIWPHATIESARNSSSENPEMLLCGERGGQIIEGFDMGNSPREFPPKIVKGKTLIHCTTNGTVALEQCRGAARILIGAFVNLEAIVQQLIQAERAGVVCAGTDQVITGEDVLFAGAVACELKRRIPHLSLNDQALIAAEFWKAAEVRTEAGTPLSDTLSNSRGGISLKRIGYDADIEYCSQINRFDFAPELDSKTWRVRLP